MHRYKVKFSHTRYPALGPELIPVYRQVGCHYITRQLLSQPKSVTTHQLVPNYTAR